MPNYPSIYLEINDLWNQITGNIKSLSALTARVTSIENNINDGIAPSGVAGGVLSGNYPDPSNLSHINGVLPIIGQEISPSLVDNNLVSAGFTGDRFHVLFKGVDASNTGVNTSIFGASGSTISNDGGSIQLIGGLGNIGGPAWLIGGSSLGAGQTGSSVYVYGGRGAKGGNAFVQAGPGTTGDGGNVYIYPGVPNSSSVNAPGDVYIWGQPSYAAGKEGSDIYVWGGDGDTLAGDIEIYAGSSSQSTGGRTSVLGGDSKNLAGGELWLYSGKGYGTVGGDVRLYAGDGYTDGGNVVIRAGSGSTGNTGGVYMSTLPVDNTESYVVTIDNSSGLLSKRLVTTLPSSNSFTGNVTLTAGNVVVDSGYGISFAATSGGTGTSNTSEVLDDYEKGNWTPALSGSGVSAYALVTYGRYMKIGNQVFVYCRITNDVFPVDSMDNGVPFYVTGLPFAASNNYGAVTTERYPAFGSCQKDSDSGGTTGDADNVLSGYVLGNTSRIVITSDMFNGHEHLLVWAQYATTG